MPFIPARKFSAILEKVGSRLRGYMMFDQLAPDFLLRLQQERDTLRAYLLYEKAAAGNGGDPQSRIEAECLRRIGVPLSIIRRTPPEGLTVFVQGAGGLTMRSLVLAEILLADAELCGRIGDWRQATGSRLQAFCLIAGAIQGLPEEERIRYRARLILLGSELHSSSDNPYFRDKIDEFSAIAGLEVGSSPN